MTHEERIAQLTGIVTESCKALVGRTIEVRVIQNRGQPVLRPLFPEHADTDAAFTVGLNGSSVDLKGSGLNPSTDPAYHERISRMDVIIEGMSIEQLRGRGIGRNAKLQLRIDDVAVQVAGEKANPAVLRAQIRVAPKAPGWVKVIEPAISGDANFAE